MNKPYETMRRFWMDATNLKHKQEVPLLGDKKICVAGVEMAALDKQGALKHILIVASSLGNASVYFENNSPSGIGGFTGGGSNGPVKEAAQHLMQAAADAGAQLPEVAQVSVNDNPAEVSLFALAENAAVYAARVAETEVRKAEHPLYAFFAYTQQLLGAFRAEQEKAQTAASATLKNSQETKMEK